MIQSGDWQSEYKLATCRSDGIAAIGFVVNSESIVVRNCGCSVQNFYIFEISIALNVETLILVVIGTVILVEVKYNLSFGWGCGHIKLSSNDIFLLNLQKIVMTASKTSVNHHMIQVRTCTCFFIARGIPSNWKISFSIGLSRRQEGAYHVIIRIFRWENLCSWITLQMKPDIVRNSVETVWNRYPKSQIRSGLTCLSLKESLLILKIVFKIFLVHPIYCCWDAPCSKVVSYGVWVRRLKMHFSIRAL